jgi:hypothetical protein
MDTLIEIECEMSLGACRDRCNCEKDANLNWQLNVGEYFS